MTEHVHGTSWINHELPLRVWTSWAPSGSSLNIRTVFTGVWILFRKIRRSWDRHTFMMWISVLVRRYGYTETTSCTLREVNAWRTYKSFVVSRLVHCQLDGPTWDLWMSTACLFNSSTRRMVLAVLNKTSIATPWWLHCIKKLSALCKKLDISVELWYCFFCCSEQAVEHIAELPVIWYIMAL